MNGFNLDILEFRKRFKNISTCTLTELPPKGQNVTSHSLRDFKNVFNYLKTSKISFVSFSLRYKTSV